MSNITYNTNIIASLLLLFTPLVKHDFRFEDGRILVPTTFSLFILQDLHIGDIVQNDFLDKREVDSLATNEIPFISANYPYSNSSTTKG